MNGPNEEKLKAMAQELDSAKSCGASVGGKLGRDVTEPGRPSIMVRLCLQKNRALQEASQFERLAELQFLLEKNPEVARILDLMDCLKG